MSDNLPPIPQGYRYAGRLKDHEGQMFGRTFDRLNDDNWGICDNNWWGMKHDLDDASADWHIIVPDTEESSSPDVKTMGAVTICRNGYVEDLERDLAAVSAQRDALALDAARLDFLQANHLTAWRVSHDEWEHSKTGIPGCGTRKEVFDGWVVREGDEPNMDIRAAIDAAMERGVR